MTTTIRQLAIGIVAATLISTSVTACSDSNTPAVTVAQVTLTPPTATVRAGETVALQARAVDSAGTTVVATTTWSTNNKSVATVSSSGVVTALSAGDVRVAASVLGKSAVTSITVTPRVVASVIISPATVSIRVGVTATLFAQTLDAEGAALTGRTIVWSSSNPAVASVNAQGIITAVAAGAATISATSEGRTGQVAVTVTLPPVQTVSVAPTIDTLGIGTTRQHVATIRDANGIVLTGRAIAWTSSNIAVVSVSSSGVTTGLAPGTATITATSEGRSGSASVLVLARLAGTVALSPTSNTLVAGSTQQLTVQITDSLGNLLTGRPITYTSASPAVATVNATGLVTALTPGSTRITATSEGKSGVATIDVIAEPVAVVQLTPSTVALLTGATQQLSAVARSNAGVELTNRNTTWTTGAPSVARVSATGLVTAVAPGIAIILVSIDGVTATAEVRVALPTIATIGLTPAAPSLAQFENVQLVATPRDAAGNALTGRTVTWTSSDENVAFVSSSGLVVGFKSGTARITATSEGVSASTTITVR